MFEIGTLFSIIKLDKISEYRKEKNLCKVIPGSSMSVHAKKINEQGLEYNENHSHYE